MQQYKHIGVYALVINNDSVLLIKKARGPYTGRLDLPGGGLEFGESPLAGLTRELKEETGLSIKEQKLLEFLSHNVIYQNNNEDMSMYHLGVIYQVQVNDPVDHLQTTGDGQDSLGAVWVKISDIDYTNLSPFAETMIKKIK